jgi:uncharacterized protein (DUF305 family)
MLLIAACQPGEPPKPSTTAGAADIDRAFIDMMVPHHQSAIEMAQLATERAEHDELRQLADAIISEQQREIGELRGWRQEWFGSAETPPMSAMPLMPGMEMPGMPGHTGGTMDMTVDIAALRTAAMFDQSFLELMIDHHRSAIAAAEIAQRESDVPQVRTLAGQIIASQQAEIEQMAGWLQEWYDVSPAPSAHEMP